MPIDPASCRASTVLASVIYMMTVYQRSHCPRLALSIAAHLDCLSRHAGVDAAIREVADGMHDEWHMTARNHARPAGGADPMKLN